MEKTLRMSLLFDFYGPLLTKRQQEVFQMYFHEDLSLGEIGEQLQVSRQAVYDLLKRAGATVEEYEKKLGLLLKHQKQQEFYEKTLALVQDLHLEGQDVLGRLKKLEDQIVQAQSSG